MRSNTQSNVTYFNPHSREGSDCQDHPFWQPELISIHTPAKGVTFR
ncbi:hypothetical protein RUMGNA_03716 [Mediterraneibacter gnavus ATCC 29149]|uniref:Uncharacterized protein n=1 Tax=Mediterraneibacter gnavus (strain ATCC 29149 / DSM 114966 / JCM 6515 / VPI C7-9) TaxID=411470 RepID=A7B800_MEDG7|nr:hypothetical protein RUMGNA_03716 [Mediterraneibacter gnavus ATCC 29149]